jgi:DNA polymerase I-like protein with 3'-5' exonuclease and polymerase domains
VPLIDTATLKQGKVHAENEAIYNGLDSGVTYEIWEELSSLLADEPADSSPRLMYNFERALQGPALEMMLRGIRVDEYERQRLMARIRKEIAQLQEQLNEFSMAVWDHGLNPRSPPQLKTFFYERMKLPPVITYQKGVRKTSMNRESLEKLEAYLPARPIISTILAIRDRAKVLETLETEIDPDGRYRFSINIAGTETWRLSSSKSATGSGNNAQNWKRDDDIDEGEVSVRSMLIADPGMKLASMDLEQAEAYEVGWLHGILFGDWKYLDACEAGDLHTQTAKLIWPDLPWTGNKAQDRKIAEQPFYRHYTYRDISKRGGFLTNYMGTAWTASRRLKTPQSVMQTFQDKYAYGSSCAYPAFQLWWQYVAQQLQTTQVLRTPFGAERMFFGRPNDDATLREAIAFSPQSSTATRTNLGLWRIWHFMGKVIQVLLQIHDSIVFQYPEGMDEAKLFAEVQRHADVRLRHSSGREFTVPAEVKCGWNLGFYSAKENPNGLRKFNSAVGDSRSRQQGGVGRIM